MRWKRSNHAGMAKVHLRLLVCFAFACTPVFCQSVESSVQEPSSSEQCSRPASIMDHEMELDILLILGSVRNGRNAERVGKFMQKQLEDRGHKVKVLDPQEVDLAQVKQPFHFYRNPTEAPQLLHKLNKQIQEADAFVVVATEYNSAIGPALCSLMDHFPPASYAFRPSGIVTYSMGNFGGIRAAMQLRQYMSELQTVHMPSLVTISKVHENLSESGEPTGEGKAQLPQSALQMIKELEFYGRALKYARKNGDPPRPAAR